MKYKYIYILILLFLSVVCLAQDNKNNECNKWAVDVSIGQSKGVKPYSSGYYSSNPNKYFNFSNTNHIALGVRYMFNSSFGLKFDGAFDNLKNETNNGSLPFQTNQYRIGFQAVSNIGKIMQFESFTNRLGLLAHAGIQLSMLIPKTGLNKSIGEQDGGLMFGLTPQYKLNNWIVFTADFTVINNLRQHYNWDGSYANTIDNLSGLMYNTSLGITCYLGKNKSHLDWSNNSNNGDHKILEENQSRLDKIEQNLKDSDLDGVPDYLDLEKNTQKGVSVDSHGRFIDTNKNGIPDELEKINSSSITDPKENELENLKTLVNKGLVNIYFDTNKDIPNENAANNLFQIVQYLQAYPSTKVKLTGYADYKGSESKNLDLSKRRSEKIKELLVSFGITPDRINIVYEGVENKYSNTQIGLAISRRVSIEFN